MLVLTRKTGQRIMIGDDIEIAVLSTSGEKVRLGISAGKEVPIYREEVYERIKGEDGAGKDGAGDDGSVDAALQELSGSKD